VDELIEKLKGDLPSEEARATVEAELWLATRAAKMDVAKGAPQTIAKLTGGSIFGARMRRDLWMFGPAARPLWDRVATGMPLRTAREILHRSRKEGTSIYEALRAHDEFGYEVRMPDGRTVRRRRPKPAGRRSWDKIREDVLKHAREELGEVGAADAERLARQLDAELREVLRDHRARATRLKARQEGGMGILVELPHSELRAACRELGVPAPAPGKPVDLDAARKRKRELVKRYHPDATGSEESRPALEAVVAAFLILEKHNESIEVGGNHVQGREAGAEVVG
jgi:hypothetical protein